jgi:hypothetical protein
MSGANSFPDPVVSISEAAKMIGLSPWTLKRQAKFGKIKVLRLSPRRLGGTFIGDNPLFKGRANAKRCGGLAKKARPVSRALNLFLCLVPDAQRRQPELQSAR